MTVLGKEGIRMKKKAAAAVLLGMTMLVTGCAAQKVAAEKQPVQSIESSAGTEAGKQAELDSQNQAAAEAGTEKETETMQRIIGKKSEGACSIEITNKTGNAVREFYIREAKEAASEDLKEEPKEELIENPEESSEAAAEDGAKEGWGENLLKKNSGTEQADPANETEENTGETEELESNGKIDVIEADETAWLYYNPDDHKKEDLASEDLEADQTDAAPEDLAAGETDSAQEGSEAADAPKKMLCDLKAVLEDGTECVVSGVDLLDMKELSLCRDGELFYAVYKDSKNKEVSTKDEVLAKMAAGSEAETAATEAAQPAEPVYEEMQEEKDWQEQDPSWQEGQQENVPAATEAWEEPAEQPGPVTEAYQPPQTEAPAVQTDPPAVQTERYVVSQEYFDDCDGSGHGYSIITYSDGSTETVEY